MNPRAQPPEAAGGPAVGTALADGPVIDTRATPADDLATPGCVYCLGNRQLDPAQVLVHGRHAYLCAPLGQLVEGFLCVAPHACQPTLAGLAPPALAEVRQLVAQARWFIAQAYGAPPVLCYEQGRGGGGQRQDADSGFPLHAHLCLLPVVPPLPPELPQRLLQALSGRWHGRPLDAAEGLEALAQQALAEPYLYVEADRPWLFTGRDAAGRQSLAAARLKPWLAELGGVPGRGDWRQWPGHQALDRLIHRWRQQ